MELQPITDAIVTACVAVITACGAVLAAYATRVLKRKLSEIEARLDGEQRLLVRELAQMAVNAAEQLGLSEQIEDKKKYAVEYVEGALASRGVYLDAGQIVAEIEAAVWVEINRPDETPADADERVSIPVVGEIDSKTGVVYGIDDLGDEITNGQVGQ